MHSCGEIHQKSILGVFTSLAIKAQTIPKPSHVLSNTYLELIESDKSTSGLFRLETPYS